MSEPAGSTFDEIAAFVAVAEARSFTRAATALGSSKSNVGKAVQRLERRLGARLLVRTTRAVRLTEEGETYLAAARGALDGLREAAATLATRRQEAIGRVRLDVPAGFGRLILPSLPTLRARHPGVTVELSLSDRQSDAVGEGWDLVLRAGTLPAGGELTARTLCQLRLGLFAAPDYLARRGTPATIDELGRHDAIVFRTPSGQLRPWTLRAGSRATTLAPRPALVLHDGRGLVDAALAGLGVAQIFDRVAAPHVAAGELLPLLPDADSDGPLLHALVPLGRRMPPKTRVVLDHLAALLRPRRRP